MNWEVYSLPMKNDFITQLNGSDKTDRPGQFFKASFNLTTTGDTYLDLSAFKKGMVWVNGHHLGRYWEIGPQKRLYCPATWLNKGENTIVVFDLHQLDAAGVTGEKTLE
jgi:beta-galactosidase